MVLCLGLLAGCGGGKVKHAGASREGPVVILGDSLGAAYGVPEEEGFVALLGARLGRPLVNLSRSGATTAQALERFEGEVLPTRPALLLLQLGGNDALQRVDPIKTRENLSQMIAAAQAQGIPVILLGVRGGLLSDTFEEMYEGLAKEYETGYVSNLLDGILTRPELKLDSVHPNAQGHRLIADRVEPELRRVLAQMEGAR